VFTGLVQELGTVKRVSSDVQGARVEIDAPLANELSDGDSVLVNGVCLTAVGTNGSRFEADLSAETLSRSTLGQLGAGDAVNLELPLRLQDRLGGHLVQGHTDAVAEVRAVSPDGDGLELRLEPPDWVLRYIVEKGSVTLDGVSLTVTRVDDHGFGVSLIPETLARTNLKNAQRGHRVNLEVDVLAKYVEKLVSRHNEPLARDGERSEHD
jgi:riboflavin synthase